MVQSQIVLICLSSLSLILYCDGYNIANECLMHLGPERLIIIEPDIAIKMIWILIAAASSLDLFKYHTRTVNLYTSHICTFGLMIVIQLTGNIVQKTELFTLSMKCIFIIFMQSAMIYQNISLYQRLTSRNAWFYGKNTSCLEYRYVKWSVFLCLHIFVYIHCFVWLKECNLVSLLDDYHFINCTLVLVLYFIFFTTSNASKLDLYSLRYQFYISVVMQTILYLYVVLRAYGLNDYLTTTSRVSITNLIIGSMIISFIGIPKWLSQRNKHARFIEIIGRDQRISMLWSEYICLYQHNFQQFQVHLINLEIFQNLLFLLELNQYKQAVLTKVDKFNSGYLLEFDTDIIPRITGIGETPIIQDIKSMDINRITSEQIRNDMDHLFSKYLTMTNDNALFVTFASSSERRIIKQRIKTSKELEVLTLFDDILRTVNNTMQLLYEMYISCR